MRRVSIFLGVSIAFACTPTEAPSDESAAEVNSAEANSAEANSAEANSAEANPAEANSEANENTAAAGQTSFGAALSERALVELADITGEPERFAGQVVKTEGEITQVCQRMGCWMEMQSEGGPAIRVPMAGHDFFLPRDAAGRRATIEGEVAIRELSEAEREHLASEGAQAVATALQISATGVVLH